MSLPIPVPEADLAALCQRHRIQRLALFGSVLREDFTPQSDVDVLVEFEPGTRLSLFGMARVENELCDLLGRKVDIHEPQSLLPALRERILSAAREVYVAA